MVKKQCKNCLYFQPQNQNCSLGFGKVDPQYDYCPRMISQDDNLGNCDICGQPVFITNGAIDAETNNIFHIHCAKMLYTCQTCSLANVCEFETNPDPMPKVVMQTIRQGNMVMQTQIRNPSRIEKFCKNCECFSQGFGCFKENGCCDGKWRK